jgi:hypothetical protein
MKTAPNLADEMAIYKHTKEKIYALSILWLYTAHARYIESVQDAITDARVSTANSTNRF